MNNKIFSTIFLVLMCVVSGCLRTEQPERLRKFLAAQQQTLPVDALTATTDSTLLDTIPHPTHLALINTSSGEFTIELYGHDAPRTVDNFIKLAERKLYRGVLIHRIVKNFAIQTGDPKTKDKRRKDEWGSGGESSSGEPFADELNPDAPAFKQGYKEGTVAMANRGPDSNTSQFFICLRDAPELPKQYTIFGRVREGMNVIHEIANEDITPILNEMDGRPVKSIVLQTIKITKKVPPVVAAIAHSSADSAIKK